MKGTLGWPRGAASSASDIRGRLNSLAKPSIILKLLISKINVTAYPKKQDCGQLTTAMRTPEPRISAASSDAEAPDLVFCK